MSFHSKENVKPDERGGKASLANAPSVAILSYCMSSILMTVTNKYVLSGYSFNMNFLLLAIQSAVCLGCISFMKSANIITYRNFNKNEAKKWFPIAIYLTVMIYTGSKALQFLNIPVYTIFKNLTIILIAYGEKIWFGGTLTPMILFSFALMVLSSVVAAWSDITTTAVADLNVGYFWMLLNCFASAIFLLVMRKRIKLFNFKDFDTMYYNNLLSIPVLLVSSFIAEDWSSANLEVNFPSENRASVIAAMVFSGLSTVGISYSSAWCVRVTSSTTYSMVGALNKLPIALSGLIFFDAPVTFSSVTAIILGFVAGLVYAVAKMQQQKAKDMSLPTSGKN